MQIQPPTSSTVRNHHLPHPITVVTGRRKPLELDLGKAQQSYGHYLQYSYPSPPMSNPPSPPRTYVATSGVTADSRVQQPANLHIAPGPSYSRSDAISSGRRDTLAETNLPMLDPGAYRPSPYSHSPQLPALGQAAVSERHYFPQRAAIPLSHHSSGVQISEIGRSAASLRSGKSSRRGKTHVQKACVNCKKAHLSCDAQRPCARCVSSSKQDTCHDVEHKKRGRPRLRDDRETRPGREIAPTEQLPVAAPPLPPAAPVYSDVPPPTHRRTQSGRILRSHRPSVGQQSQPVATQRHTIGAGPASAGLGRAPAARIFTNLSFRILRANRAFQADFARGIDVRGREISTFVEPRHEQDLQRLGTDLRSEREARDPMALPTIFSDQEQEAIDSIAEAQIDEYVAGSHERHETWYFNGAQVAMQKQQMIVQLGQVRNFPFVLFTIPYNIPIPLPPPVSGFAPSGYQSGRPSHWDQGYMTSPGPYPQSGSGPATPALSLQSLAATLPPTSASVGISSYGMSPRYPSGSSDYFPPTTSSQRTSLQSPTTQYSQAPYYVASNSSGTRPVSTVSEPGVASGQASSRRPATYHGQARTFGAMQEESEPMPSGPKSQRPEGAHQEPEGDDDGRKRRRLNIKELTD